MTNLTLITPGDLRILTNLGLTYFNPRVDNLQFLKNTRECAFVVCVKSHVGKGVDVG